ncbi:MAG: GNAT family N-acetyltransferase [Clostridia bacterium]|nr:GNAT family N-acetyltransferase [Clostridia bacterium]
MQISLRQATIEDLDQVIELWKKLSLEHLKKDCYYKGSLELDGQGIGQFENALTNPDCGIFVAESEGIIFGFSEVWKHRSDMQFFADDYAYILHMYVDEDKRAGTVSIQLVNAAENWAAAQGLKYITADVFSHNPNVMALLEKGGFDFYKVKYAKSLK